MLLLPVIELKKVVQYHLKLYLCFQLRVLVCCQTTTDFEKLVLVEPSTRHVAENHVSPPISTILNLLT
jgi:hypothetical protein